jgi:hypothetical protein
MGEQTTPILIKIYLNRTQVIWASSDRRLGLGPKGSVQPTLQAESLYGKTVKNIFDAAKSKNVVILRN